MRGVSGPWSLKIETHVTLVESSGAALPIESIQGATVFIGMKSCRLFFDTVFLRSIRSQYVWQPRVNDFDKEGLARVTPCRHFSHDVTLVCLPFSLQFPHLVFSFGTTQAFAGLSFLNRTFPRCCCLTLR